MPCSIVAVAVAVVAGVCIVCAAGRDTAAEVPEAEAGGTVLSR